MHFIYKDTPKSFSLTEEKQINCKLKKQQTFCQFNLQFSSSLKCFILKKILPQSRPASKLEIRQFLVVGLFSFFFCFLRGLGGLGGGSKLVKVNQVFSGLGLTLNLDPCSDFGLKSTRHQL